MTVKDGIIKLNELDALYDNFIAYTDEHKREDISPMLHDICIALSDFRFYLRKIIDNTEINFNVTKN